MTGQQQVLNAFAITGVFTVDISNPTPEYPYAWLNNINDISMNRTTTGCGFAVLKNDASTDALNSFTVQIGDVLKIWMAPFADGGFSSFPVTRATELGGDYYLGGATDTVTITITA